MKIYLFDIDGTLTEPRKKMSDNHVLSFLSWMTNKNVYLVTGSDYQKVKEDRAKRHIIHHRDVCRDHKYELIEFSNSSTSKSNGSPR